MEDVSLWDAGDPVKHSGSDLDSLGRENRDLTPTPLDAARCGKAVEDSWIACGITD
jgi:hypothetical protein